MLGDVGDPQLVRAGPVEVSTHEVGHDDPASGALAAPVSGQAGELGAAHQQPDRVVPDHDSAGVDEFGVDP